MSIAGRVRRLEEAKGKGGKPVIVFVDIETREPFPEYMQEIESAERDGREIVRVACQRDLWEAV